MSEHHVLTPMPYMLCNVNGVFVRLIWQKAHELLWALHLGWILPVGFYRYKLGRHRRKFFLHEEGIEAAEQEFGFALHAARCRPVTEYGVPSGDDGEMGISRGAFLTRRSRYGKIYPASCDPIETVSTLDRSRRATTGYLFRRGIRWIVVLDTDPPNQLVDWELLTRPPGQGTGAIDPLLADADRVHTLMLMPPKDGE